MAGTATLTVNNNPIANAPVRMTLTVTNTSGTDVTLTSVSPSVTPNTGSFSMSPMLFSPGSTTTVAASNGTLSVPLQAVFYTPILPGPPNATATSSYSVTFICQFSDGSVFSPSPLTVAIGPGTKSPFAPGALRFDEARNSAYFLLLM